MITPPVDSPQFPQYALALSLQYYYTASTLLVDRIVQGKFREAVELQKSDLSNRMVGLLEAKDYAPYFLVLKRALVSLKALADENQIPLPGTLSDYQHAVAVCGQCSSA
jgi:hypothetical protein